MVTKTDIFNLTANVSKSSEVKDSVIRGVVSENKIRDKQSVKIENILNGMTEAYNKSFSQSTRIHDGSFNNPVLKLGLSNESLMSAEFLGDMITFQRWTITAVYHGSWIFRRIIDKVAQDMWSSGISILGDADPDSVKQVQKLLSRLRSYLIWVTEQARLYGGAAALMMVDDGTDDLSKPLNLAGIKPGTPIQLWGTDRWYGMSTSTEKVTNYRSKDFNTPKYYNFFVDDTKTDPSLCVHHSRVLRFVNRRSVRIMNSRLNGWGISELEHIFQELMNHENAKNAASALVEKALLEIVKVEGLRGVMQGLSTGSSTSQAMLSGQLYGIQQFRTNNLVLMDKGNEYENYAYSFTGISDLLETQRDSVAGAAEMPKVLIYGDTKGGLTSDSPAELLFYAGTILGKQDEMLRPVLDKLLPVLFACSGVKIPKDLDYEFESIVSNTQGQKSELLNTTVSNIQSLIDLGIMTHETGLKEIQQVQKVTGFGTNLNEKDEELAKNSDIPEEQNSMGEQVGGEDYSDDTDYPVEEPKPLTQEEAIEETTQTEKGFGLNDEQPNEYNNIVRDILKSVPNSVVKEKVVVKQRVQDESDKKIKTEIISAIVSAFVKKHPNTNADDVEKHIRHMLSTKEYTKLKQLAKSLGCAPSTSLLIDVLENR